MDERSKYKSWSNLRKQIHDLLCDSLKDKISYFYTGYHEVHNAYGRATINYNKKELVAFSWDIGYRKWDDEYAALNQNDINAETMGSFPAVWEAQIQIREELNKSKWMPACKLCETDFIHAVTAYLKTEITTSLRSDHYLLRVFAYMDRRVGKRTLLKIKDDVEKLPEWVKQFYQIRCEADGIVFPPKGTKDKAPDCFTNRTFRLARPEDAQQVLSLYKSAQGGPFCTWNDSYPTGTEIRQDLATDNLYVMTDGRKPIGAISVVPENELDGFGCWTCEGREIARVVIDRDCQGQGLAFEMVQHIESILRKTGCQAIHLSVVKSNLPAYKTYLKAGFSVVGEAQMYGNDYYLMEKTIGAEFSA